MNFKSIIIPLAALTLTATACNKEADMPDLPLEENTNETVTAVTYNGVTPCASCPGIDTRITLNGDGTYTKVEKYLESDESAITTEGDIVWSDNNTKATLGDITYIVTDNELIQLDSEGNRVEGELADKYVLDKIDVEKSVTEETTTVK